jgi:hypothetical protein
MFHIDIKKDSKLIPITLVHCPFLLCLKAVLLVLVNEVISCVFFYIMFKVPAIMAVLNTRVRNYFQNKSNVLLQESSYVHENRV